MMTKEELIERLKSSIQRKNEWKKDFERRFAGVENIYTKLQQA